MNNKLELKSCLYEEDNHILILKWNRPSRKNAIDANMYFDVIKALKYASSNDNIKIVIMTGVGEYYSSGNDLANFMSVDLSNKEKVESLMKQSKSMMIEYIDAFIDFPKILISCVNGPSIGIATTHLAHCDFVFASDSATFHTPFISIAQVPECCSSYLFPKILGKAKAMDVLVNGRKFNANEAKEWGLVNEVFPKDKAFEMTIEFAKNLVEQPYGALLKAKQLLRPKEEIEILKQVNRKEADVLYTCWISDELKIALMKFATRKRSKL